MKSLPNTFLLIKKAVFLAVLLFVFVPAIQASDTNMTGEWTMQVKSANGSGSPVFTLKQDGDALSGTYAGRFGEAPVTGSVKGDDFEIKYEMNGLTVVYAGKVNGNSCEGNVDYGPYGTATFTGKK